MSLELTVVVIGRNEGSRLERCLKSVQAMNYPRDQTELIYVDSDSQDGSPERARKLGATVLTVHPERPAAAIGRNAGWQAAQAPFILFLDGDTLVHPDFVKTALPILQANPQVAVVWGHRRELAPHASLYQRVLDLDWIYPPGISEFCGGDALMRRSVLAEVGGYNPLLIAGEEPEMCQRIRANGYLILHIDQPMTLHDLAIHHGSQYWRHAVRAGHAFAEISNLLRHTPTPLWQWESRHNFLHTLALSSILIIGLGITVFWQSLWPLLFSGGLLILIGLRSAWKARHKSNNWLTLLLYGFHSQFQHLPITVGQLAYYYHRWRGQRQRLIEYK